MEWSGAFQNVMLTHTWSGVEWSGVEWGGVVAEWSGGAAEWSGGAVPGLWRFYGGLVAVSWRLNGIVLVLVCLSVR